MRLSILMPSHRADLTAYSRIAQACSWAAPGVEIVVRDNSGKPEKRDFIERFSGDNRRIVFAPECDATTNFKEALALARGDFVFFISDDDYCFERGISAVTGMATKFGSDPSVAGITGSYILEQLNGSMIVSYRNLETPDVVARVASYLEFQGPNLLFYTPIRRNVLVDCWKFLQTHPFPFSFHDQILALLYLLSGRFIDVNRMMFLYDNANWDVVKKAQSSDLAVYLAAGMDPALGRLHWLLCGIEGANLVLNSRYARNHTAAQRQEVAIMWFQLMFARFSSDRRESYGSPLAQQADILCDKWRQRFPNFQLDELLLDVCGFIALSSPDNARKYHAFWTSGALG